MGNTEITTGVLNLKQKLFLLPFSNWCKIGAILVFQKTSSTSISVSFSCTSAFETAKEIQEKAVNTGVYPEHHHKSLFITKINQLWN